MDHYIKKIRQHLHGLWPNPDHKKLSKIIERHIRQYGPITFEKYMEFALQYPGLGYYRQGNPIGKNGDFDTAPEVSQMFGEIIGVWIFDEWQKLGSPQEMAILELGPGRGTLLYDALSFLSSCPDFPKQPCIQLFELNETLRIIQKSKLAKYSPVHIDDLKELSVRPAIVIANEFFDNLPVRQFERVNGRWFENLVGLENTDQLAYIQSNISNDEATEFNNLCSDHNELTPLVLEISSQAQIILKQLADHIRTHCGAFVIIDYGPWKTQNARSITGWKNHKKVDVLKKPGSVDITVDVNFDVIRRIALQQNLTTSDLISQRDFLIKYGLSDRVRILSQLNPNKSSRIDAAFDQLTSPYKMGIEWKVMVAATYKQKAAGTSRETYDTKLLGL